MTHLLRYLTIDRLEQIVRDALAAGRPVRSEGARRFILPYQGSCTDPHGVELHSRFQAVHDGQKRPIIVDMAVPCRKCEACRLRRSLMWKDRAEAEYRLWPISIFGTLTFRPEVHYMADAILTSRLRAGGTDWSALTSAEQFAERSKLLGSYVSTWLKTVRWGRRGSRLLKDRPRFSYLIVCEAHDGEFTSAEMRGRPHFHTLFHTDNDGRFIDGNPLQALLSGSDGDFVRKNYRAGNVWRPGVFVVDCAPMRLSWEHGFSKFQWAHDEKTASYLTKYLSKTLDARVRASQGYGLSGSDGKPPAVVDTEPRPS